MDQPLDLHPNTTPDPAAGGPSRRAFLQQFGSLVAASTLAPGLAGLAEAEPGLNPGVPDKNLVSLTLRVNGKSYPLTADPRLTLLDALREKLRLPGTKKGCDQGACGACTVHVDGRRINSCLTLAAMSQGQEIVTIEGLAQGEALHPMQTAFLQCDAFQCGYCTPGQIMSAVACVREGHTGSDDEIQEWMSGNICRCGAYPNIVAAIKTVKKA